MFARQTRFQADGGKHLGLAGEWYKKCGDCVEALSNPLIEPGNRLYTK